MLDPLRVVIVDDEPTARARVRRLLSSIDDIEVVGEAGDGRCGADLIRALRPDGAILDISMPERSGLELLRDLPADARPAVIVATAYPDYAVEAFDLDVVDYLVKPFGAARLERACVRLRAAQGPAATGWLAARDSDDRVLLRPQAITKVVAEGNYVRLFSGDARPLVRGTLMSVHRRLQPFGFIQVSRSTLVRSELIRAARPAGRGDMILELADGDQLMLSRRYRDVLDRRLLV